MNSTYKVSNIGIYLDTSDNKFWQTYMEQQLLRQLYGFQCDAKSANALDYRLEIHDYSLLHLNSNVSIVVPHYCVFSSDGVYVDMQSKRGIRVAKGKVDYWCSANTLFSIPFLLQFLFLQQGKTFSHSAAISVDGAGILLPAFGGVGKTSFIARAVLDPRVRMIGDDLVILTEDGLIEPYYRPFCLYQYHKPLFPDFFANHDINYSKPVIWAWQAYHKLINIIRSRLGVAYRSIPQNIAISGYVPVSPTKLFQNSSLEKASVPIYKIYLLRRGRRIADLTVKQVDEKYVTSFMLNVVYHEFYMFARFLYSWLSHVGMSLSEYFVQAEKPIRAVIRKAIEIKEIIIPEEMQAAEVSERLFDVIIKV